MKISDILTGPEKWTKGTSARDSDGQSCSFRSPYAVCWCIAGAAAKLAAKLEIDTGSLIRVLDEAGVRRGYRGFVQFNDAPETTFADVQALLAECGQ